MQKRAFTIMSALLLLACVAQSQSRVAKVYSNGQTIYTSPTTGNNRITFSNGQAVFSHNGAEWSTRLSTLDSLVFATDTGDDDGDSVAVDYAGGIRITWDGPSVAVVNPFEGRGVSVATQEGHVTIVATIDSADLSYILSGSSSEGSLSITSARPLVLSLDTLSLTHSAGPAIAVASDVRAALFMHGANTLSDGSGGSHKGALQSTGKLHFHGPDTLALSGLTKHGLQSSGKTTMAGGTLQVLTAVKDGMNVDDYVMTGGVVDIASLGDGLDADQGYIRISGGQLSIRCASANVKGMGCDSTISLSGGVVDITVEGDQSKGIKGGQDIYISGGSLTVNANGTVALESSGSGYDPSYCVGVKAKGNVTVAGGEATITCPTTNAGGRAIATDGDFAMTQGTLTLTATGGCARYLDVDGVYDKYASTGIKADGSVTIEGGVLYITAGGRGIKCDGSYTQRGGTVVATTSAAGFTTIGSGSSCTDGFAPACLNSDGDIRFEAGTFSGTSTGTGGRGITADGRLLFGIPGGSDSTLLVSVTTSGSPVNAVSGGGWGGWGGGSSTDTWKGLPKGVKVEDSIHIYSGHLRSYCSQTSGDPNGEAIETKGVMVIDGGFVEANSYDDAINSATSLTINGGYVWAYSRGNDAIDNNGTYTYFNGGTVIALSDSEMGVDASTDAGGHFYINGATVVSKGTMGAWDTPTTSGSTQKYLSLGSSGGGWGGWGGGSSSSVSITDGFCIRSGSTDVLIFKSPTISGSGFETGTKPPPGGRSGGSVAVTSPAITSGTYTYFTPITVSGGSHWHGLYSGASCTSTSSGTSVTAQ